MQRVLLVRRVPCLARQALQDLQAQQELQAQPVRCLVQLDLQALPEPIQPYQALPAQRVLPDP